MAFKVTVRTTRREPHEGKDGLMMTGARKVHGVCPHDCYDTCGLEITAQDNQVIRIRGEQNHPITQGFACLKINRYQERLNHPDRVLYPLRRTGPKGSGKFTRCTWDEAMTEIGRQLQHILQNYGGEAVLPYSFSGNMGILSEASMDRRFFHAIGASRLARTICTASADAAWKWVYGSRIGPDPESISHARFIVLWGTNPVATNIHQIPLLDKAVEQGADLVVIDPLQTETVDRYGSHIRLNPGTDAVLAMGIGRYLVDEKLYDADFVAHYSVGLDAYRQFVEPWTLEKTAALTGVKKPVIQQLAWRLKNVQPLLIRTGYGVQRHQYGALAIWAISALSILTGSYRHPGGGHLVSNSEMFPINWEKLTRPDLLRGNPREINMLQLGNALSPALNPPIKALIVYNSNPAATAPDQSAVLQGLMRDDLLTIVHEQMLTDTARYADWVLPAAMFPEILDVHTSYWHRYVQLNQPAVTPAGEAVSNTEFFRRLAQAVGLGRESWALDSDETLIKQALDTDHPWLQGITWDSLQSKPVQKLRLSIEDRPFIDFGWPQSGLRLDPLPLIGMGFKEFVGANVDDRYPLWLITPSRKNTIKSSFANIKSLLVKEPVPTVYMHPQDMKIFNVNHGDKVELYNDRGSCHMIVHASERVSPGVLLSYAVRWNADGNGKNVNQLTSQTLSDYGGGSTFYNTRVNMKLCQQEESCL